MASTNALSRSRLLWQSKLVLLLVLPFVAADVVLQSHWWAANAAPVAIWTLGLSLIFGLVAWKLRTATPWAAASGAVIAANLMLSTAVAAPFRPWQTALTPVFAVFLLSFVATRLGRERKERLGIAERRGGRTAAQVAANLGFAALIACPMVQIWLSNSGFFLHNGIAMAPLFAPVIAALAEAAADTVSSEVGQVFGGTPRLITTLREVEPGVDGAISPIGTLAGIAAACITALAGAVALHRILLFGSHWEIFWLAAAGGIFGLFFDSLLGATLERRGWLNNDAVNFLSTASASAFALGLLALLSRAAAL